MCCGQKRSELRNTQAPTRAASVPPRISDRAARTAYTQTRSIEPRATSANSSPSSWTKVRYLETSPIRVRGPVSGNRYEFSGTQPVQQVDSRDASALLNTRFFQRA